MLEGRNKVFDPDLIYNAICPSNEILEWFGHRIEDSSYDTWGCEFQLPPSLSDTNWIGLSICVSYPIRRVDWNEPNSHHFNLTPNSHHFNLTLKTLNNGLSSLHRYQISNEEYKFVNHCHIMNRRFIWVSYIPRRWFLHQLNDESVLFASLRDTWWSRAKIHHRFVYAHDVEEF
ncbi:hypothetical protein ABKV19_007470 [Rosa sericea]